MICGGIKQRGMCGLPGEQLGVNMNDTADLAHLHLHARPLATIKSCVHCAAGRAIACPSRTALPARAMELHTNQDAS